MQITGSWMVNLDRESGSWMGMASVMVEAMSDRLLVDRKGIDGFARGQFPLSV